MVTTEQILSRNGVNAATHAWTFGQTLALILLLAQIIDLCSTMDKIKGSTAGEKQDENPVSC